MKEYPSHAQFLEQLNTPFRLNHDSPAELVLVQVGELRSLPRQEMYSIVFLGPPRLSLPQGTYTLQHDVLGDLDLFLVPVGQEGELVLFEAVFNRLVH